jgi:surface antigen
MCYKGNARDLTRAFAWPSVGVFLVALGLGGCSVSMPMGSLLGDDNTTGSIPQSDFDGLVGEDWQLAKAALAEALAGNQAAVAVAWTNPDSGTKGSFSAVGAAYATASGTCRGFAAAVDRNQTDDSLQGTACANRPGDWQVTDVRPFKKG